MTLSENPSLGGWTGQAVCRGRPVEVNIDADMWEVGPQEAARSGLETIERRWLQIENALVGAPLNLYNGSWADASQGLARLTAPQFLEKLKLASVSIGQGSITLYFTDGNLFAGHTVSVILLGDQEARAILEG